MRVPGAVLAAVLVVLLVGQGLPQERRTPKRKKKPDEAAPEKPGDYFAGRAARRGLEGEGGGEATESAVDSAIGWLAWHQDVAGHWDSDGFSAQCKLNQCDGPGRKGYDVGVTGLSLLVFLTHGETHKEGAYCEAVRKGILWLVKSQDDEGCIGDRTDPHFVYGHAFATTALVEAYGMTQDPLLKDAAQKAVDFIQACQNPYLAWRYGKRPGENDTSISACMTVALHSAKKAGLTVGQEGFDGMKAWLDKVTEPEYGRAGYTARGTGPARPEAIMDKYPADKSESLTAAGIVCRVFIGEDPRKSEMIQKGVDLCLKCLPIWDEWAGSIDMYYWYWGSMALHQVGGDAWKSWNVAVRAALVDNQRKSGDEKGSWDPIGPWGRDGGRVYSTALNALTLEVYCRYPRIFEPLKTKKAGRRTRRLR